MYTVFSQNTKTFEKLVTEHETLEEARRRFDLICSLAEDIDAKYYNVVLLQDGKPIDAKYF